MGNPTIWYDKYSIDLGNLIEECSIVNMASRDQAKSLGGINQFVLWDTFHKGRIKFKEFNNYTLWHDLKAFWSWAMRGNPFYFGLDSAKNYLIFLDAQTEGREVVIDGGFEEWTSAADTLENWTKVESGSTLFKRETDEHDVYAGGNCVRIDNDLTNASYLEQTSADSIPASAACSISVFYKSNDDTKGRWSVRLKNNTTGNWLQSNGTWAAGVDDIASYVDFKDDDDVAYGDGKARYRRAHFDFNNDTSAGTFLYRINSSISAQAASKDWFDNFSIRCESKKIPLQSTYGITANDFCWLQSRDGWGEIVKVSSITAGDYITVVDPLKFNYASGDFLRYRDYWCLQVDPKQIQEAMREDAGLQFPFDLRVIEYRQGRT